MTMTEDTLPEATHPSPGRRRGLWVLLLVVLLAALVVGSGLLHSSPPTPAQRAAAIDAVIRCPSCEDLSVANSSAPTAQSVRSTVARLVAEGKSDAQITSYLSSRYGSAIVLEPPSTGWAVLVWLLPVAFGVVAVVALTVVLVRRRGRGVEGLDQWTGTGSTDRAALDERRRFLVASLADADAEFLAGDLSAADYHVLQDRDRARLAAVESSLGALLPEVSSGSDEDQTTGAAAPEGRRLRIRRSPWFLVGTVACFAVAAVLVVPAFTSVRLPGQTPTGSVSLSPTQQTSRTLDQAAALEDQGQVGGAASLYQSVLATHPNNEVALAQLGWLEYRVAVQGGSSSLLADARQKLAQAVALNPHDWAAHLYQGTIDLEHDGNPAAATTEFGLFLAADPPATVLAQSAAVVRSAYLQAGRPVPPQVPAS